jgi:uncharacterized SAM-binding protein YcdF (DUF218 family)
MAVLTFITFVLFGLFAWLLYRIIKTDPRTLELGTLTILATLFLVMLVMLLLSFAGGFGLAVLGLGVGGGIVLFLLGAVVFNLLVVIFSWQIWRKEYHSFANLLLPILFGLFILMNIVQSIEPNMPNWLQPLFWMANLLEIYFVAAFINFLVGAVVYAIVNRKQDSDVYVVLGAGLIDGQKVSRLLANRIKAAVKAAMLHKQKVGELPIIIMSGGKGGDEALPEAVAMQRYAVAELDYPLEKIITEDKSETTRENMRFSRDKIVALTGRNDVAFTFFTSEYHVFRAALQARQFGVNAQGRGGKTAWYFRVTAFIREYVAILNMNRRRHAAVVISALLVAVLLMVTTLFS